MFGQDAFRMELNAEDRPFPMPDSHDLPFLGFGGDFQAIRKGFSDEDQRMISDSKRRSGDPAEEVSLVMMNQGGLSVHETPISVDSRPKYISDTLMS